MSAAVKCWIGIGQNVKYNLDEGADYISIYIDILTHSTCFGQGDPPKQFHTIHTSFVRSAYLRLEFGICVSGGNFKSNRMKMMIRGILVPSKIEFQQNYREMRWENERT